MPRSKLNSTTRVVIKVGSSLLTSKDHSLNKEFIAILGGEIKKLRDQGKEVVLVTSGAVAAGHHLSGWKGVPTTTQDLHVRAAIGQIPLFRAYDEMFTSLEIRPAQVLLTAEELSHRSTYISARSTLTQLLDLNIIPIINENDAIAISERRFGDNDRLASEISNLVEAQLLVILSDVDGIYTDFDAKEVLTTCDAYDENLRKYINTDAPKAYGSGGMGSKLDAANRAANCGTSTIIASGREKDILTRIFQGENLGTLLKAPASRMSAKERWLATCAKSTGSIYLDEGAVIAVHKQKRSILPIGVVKVDGDFRRGDVVSCLDKSSKTIAQGMVNYDARDVKLLTKKHSKDIEKILGYVFAEEIIHRDNMVILSS